MTCYSATQPLNMKYTLAKVRTQDYNYVRKDKHMNVYEEIKKYEKFGLIGRQNYGRIFLN